MGQIKTYVIILLLLFCVAFALGTKHYRNLYLAELKPRGAMPTISGPTSISAPILDAFTDAAGRQHAVIATPEAIGRRNAESIVNSSIKPTIDSLKRILAIKDKDIEGYSSVQLSTVRDSVIFLSRKLDSQRRQTRTYQDKYLTLLVRDPAPEDTNDKGSFDFSYNADIRTADYSRKRKVLGLRIGRRDYYTDISSSDPRMIIKGVNKFTMQRRVPPLGLRVQALAGYNFNTRDFAAGMGLRLDIGERLNGGINYTYNFGRQVWVPSLFAKYDLLQFGR